MTNQLSLDTESEADRKGTSEEGDSEEESSFDETSVDTDTYQYYDAVHKEYYQPKNMKRAERYDHLMKMNIAEVFRDVYEEVDRVKKV